MSFSGQVQLIGGNSRMDEDSNLMDQDMAYSSQNVAIKAQVVDKYAFNTRHESIKNLLHLQSQQKRKTPPHAHQHQNFGRPNEEWSPAPKEKVWYQINRPSFKRRKRRRRRWIIWLLLLENNITNLCYHHNNLIKYFGNFYGFGMSSNYHTVNYIFSAQFKMICKY